MPGIQSISPAIGLVHAVQEAVANLIIAELMKSFVHVHRLHVFLKAGQIMTSSHEVTLNGWYP